jgi:hypothetical protein
VVYASDAVAWLQQADDVTAYSSMAPSIVVVMGVGASADAGVDGGVATAATTVGVDDADEVGEDEGADDRVADAKVLSLLHVPAFASSTICIRRCICAESASNLSSMVAIRAESR